MWRQVIFIPAAQFSAVPLKSTCLGMLSWSYRGQESPCRKQPEVLLSSHLPQEHPSAPG